MPQPGLDLAGTVLGDAAAKRHRIDVPVLPLGHRVHQMFVPRGVTPRSVPVVHRLCNAQVLTQYRRISTPRRYGVVNTFHACRTDIDAAFRVICRNGLHAFPWPRRPEVALAARISHRGSKGPLHPLVDLTAIRGEGECPALFRKTITRMRW